jgi:adenylate cyclase 10
MLPELQSMETVVLFADISGFTMISEACASMGVRGNEELAFCINRYMEGMVKSLGKYGGDIIKFVGDAMIVMWPPRYVPSSTTEGGKGQISFKDQ